MTSYFAVQYKSGRYVVIDIWSIDRYRKFNVRIVPLYGYSTRHDAQQYVKTLNQAK